MKKILLITALFAGVLLYSQAPAFQWVKSYSQGSGISSYLIKTDNQGNIITAGTFQGVTDFDPGPGTYTMMPTGTGYDGYVSKLDPSGNFLWARQLNGQYNNFINQLRLDNAGNIYTTGAFYTSSVQATTYDGFVWKLSANGTAVFMALMGGSLFDNGIGLCLDQQNNVYTTGIINSSNADFDPGPGTFLLSGNLDGYLSKLDSLGNFVWAGVVNCSGYILEDWSVAHANGHIYHCGRFNGATDFDPDSAITTLTANGTYDGFISKLDDNGNFKWAKLIGGAKDDIASRIVSDSNGDLIVMGTYDSIADLDPGPGSFTVDATVSGGTYIIKLDSAGNLIWAKTLFPYIREIYLDNNNAVYSTGTLYSWDSPADMDPGPGTYTLAAMPNSNSAFMSKLDAAGNFKWAVMLQDTGYSSGGDICTNNLADVFSTGSFVGRVDFDPSPSTYTVSSGTGTVSGSFIHKMHDGPVAVTEKPAKQPPVHVYPNPFSQQLNILFLSGVKEAEVTIYSVAGQIVYSKHFRDIVHIQTDTGALPRGSYILEVKTENSVHHQQLIKQ